MYSLEFKESDYQKAFGVSSLAEVVQKLAAEKGVTPGE